MGVCLQSADKSTQGNGFETWRLTHARYSTPLGARSIGRHTRLLKPQLGEQKFEESFATWEFQLSKYEQAVKTAVLLNETEGPLQQPLQPQSGNITTCAQTRSMVTSATERELHSFSRLQAITSENNNQGPAPMDIGATWYNKGKGKKGKRKGKESATKAKAMAATGTTTATATTQEEKANIVNNRLDKEILSKDNKDMAKEKDTATKEKGKGITTTNKEERKQNVSVQQMFATDAGSQDTWPNNAEWRSTTATLPISTPVARQMAGTVRHATATTGNTRIRHRCHSQQYHNRHS